MQRLIQFTTILTILIIFLASSTANLYAGAIVIGGNVTITDAGLNGSRIETPDIAIRGKTIYAVWGDSRDEDTFGGFRSIYLPNLPITAKHGEAMSASTTFSTTTGAITLSLRSQPTVRFGSFGISFTSQAQTRQTRSGLRNLLITVQRLQSRLW